MAGHLDVQSIRLWNHPFAELRMHIFGSSLLCFYAPRQNPLTLHLCSLMNLEFRAFIILRSLFFARTFAFLAFCTPASIYGTLYIFASRRAQPAQDNQNRTVRTGQTEGQPEQEGGTVSLPQYPSPSIHFFFFLCMYHLIHTMNTYPGNTHTCTLPYFIT
jgi:hypothetical protein